MLVIAVDPGARACGLALWTPGYGSWAEVQARTAVAWVEPFLRDGPRGGGVLVVEQYRLYPWAAKAQTFRRMAEAEQIGELRAVARRWGTRIVEQPALVKKPTRAQLRARGLRLAAEGEHARDASLHLCHWLWRRGLQADGLVIAAVNSSADEH